MEWVLTGRSVVTFDEKNSVIKRGALVVEDGKIVDLGKKDIILRRYPRYERIDVPRGIILPGFVNAHTHAAMTLLRGYADDLPLHEWLEEKIFPLEARLTEGDVYVGAKLAAAESIQAGVTTLNSMYHFMNGEARAFEETGIRAVIGHVCFSWRKEEDIRETKKLFEKWHGREGRIRVSVDPHAPYTVDPEYMKELHALAEDMQEKYGERQVIVHTHLAETEREFGLVKEKYGEHPAVKESSSVVEYLEKLGVLSEKVVAAHCVWVDERDVQILAGKRVKVVHNPVSNLKLGSGISPLRKLLKAGVTVALGTDGACSNNTLDMLETAKFASLLAKGISRDPTSLPATKVGRMLTVEGAKALMWDDEIGSLEVGKDADVIVLDFSRPGGIPLYDEFSHLVYVARSTDVKYVFVKGKLLLEEGKLLTLDLDELEREVNKTVERLLSAL